MGYGVRKVHCDNFGNYYCTLAHTVADVCNIIQQLYKNNKYVYSRILASKQQ